MTPYQLHKKRWSGCTDCPLCEGRKNVVLCRGQLPCDVLFVGEAPGINEDVLGRPFVGPAGKLLDRMIEEATPRACRIAFTNMVACIPYDEDGRKVSEPSKESVKVCSRRLIEMVGIARPERIVSVGAVADKWLKQFKMNVEVTNIIHPAAILRAQPAQRGIMYQRCVVTLSELFESFIPF